MFCYSNASHCFRVFDENIDYFFEVTQLKYSQSQYEELLSCMLYAAKVLDGAAGTRKHLRRKVHVFQIMRLAPANKHISAICGSKEVEALITCILKSVRKTILKLLTSSDSPYVLTFHRRIGKTPHFLKKISIFIISKIIHHGNGSFSGVWDPVLMIFTSKDARVSSPDTRKFTSSHFSTPDFP